MGIPGGCVYYCEDEHVAFTGDTLFRMSIGRTDFDGGSWQEMAESLQQLAKLPADTQVLADTVRRPPLPTSGSLILICGDAEPIGIHPSTHFLPSRLSSHQTDLGTDPLALTHREGITHLFKFLTVL